MPVAHHGHDVRERHAGAIVLIGVEENTEAFKSVGRTKDRALGRAFLGEPQRKAIAMQVPGTVDFELELDLEECVSLCSAKLFFPGSKFTCQLVAVSGTREEIHPCCEGRSAVRRIYLIRQTSESIRILSTHLFLYILTCRRGLLYLLRSRTSGFGSPNRGMAVSSGQHYCFSLSDAGRAT